MRILSFIEERNDDGTNPSFNDLAENLSIVKTQLKVSISELSDKGYVKEESTLWRKMYIKTGYKITEKGKRALELYTDKVKHFVFTLKMAYDNDQKEDLYNLIKENRDFLWFGNYKKLIAKNEIENIAKKLDLSVETLWWHTEMPSGSTWFPLGG